MYDLEAQAEKAYEEFREGRNFGNQTEFITALFKMAYAKGASEALLHVNNEMAKFTK